MPLPRYRYLLLTVMFAIRVYTGFILLTPSLYIDTLMVEFGVSKGLIGFYIGLIMFASILLVLFTGPFVNKLGSKNSGSLAIAIIAVTGYLGAFAGSFLQVALSRFLMGFGIVLAVPAFSPLVMTWFAKKEYGRVNAILESSTSIGIALNFALSPILFPPPFWREAYMGYSTLALALTVIWLAAGRNPYGKMKKEKGRYFGMLKSGLVRLFKVREVVLMGGVLFVAMGVTMAITSWISKFLELEIGYGPQLAALVVVVYNILNIAAWPAGGLLSDKIGLRRPFLVFGGLMAFVSFFIALTVALTGPVILVFTFVGLFGLFNAVYGFATITIPMEHPKIGKESIPYAVSIILAFGFLGGTVMPAIVGMVSDLTGSIFFGLLVCSFPYLLVTVFGFLSRETGWKSDK